MPMVFGKNKKLAICLLMHRLTSLNYALLDNNFFSMFRATGSEFGAKTVNICMKYIVIVKMFYRVSFPPEKQQKL